MPETLAIEKILPAKKVSVAIVESIDRAEFEKLCAEKFLAGYVFNGGLALTTYMDPQTGTDRTLYAQAFLALI